MLFHVSVAKAAKKKDSPAVATPTADEESKVPSVSKSSQFFLSSNKANKKIEAEVLRNKVKSISRMMKLFKVLREENEDILKLKGLCPDNKLPKGVLLEGSTAIKDALEQFGDTKKADLPNEKRPS